MTKTTTGISVKGKPSKRTTSQHRLAISHIIWQQIVKNFTHLVAKRRQIWWILVSEWSDLGSRNQSEHVANIRRRFGPKLIPERVICRFYSLKKIDGLLSSLSLVSGGSAIDCLMRRNSKEPRRHAMKNKKCIIIISLTVFFVVSWTTAFLKFSLLSEPPIPTTKFSLLFFFVTVWNKWIAHPPSPVFSATSVRWLSWILRNTSE